MTRIVIAGNSHVGSLKSGWDAIRSDHPALDVVFFAAPKPHFSTVTIRDREIGCFGSSEQALKIARKINGTTSLSLEGVDHLVHAGTDLGMHRIPRLVAKCDIEGVSGGGKGTLLSKQVLDAILESIAEAALPSSSWFETDRPPLVSVLARPLPTEELLQNTDQKFDVWRKARANPATYLFAMDRYFEKLRSVLQDRGANFVGQAGETLADGGGFTRHEYCRDSVRITSGKEHPDTDLFHMNTEFGKIMMKKLIAELGS